MKKNNLKLIVLGVFVLLFCTACDGDITRAIRHDGFSIGSKVKCDLFFTEESALVNKIKFFTGTHIIHDSGRIYELSIAQAYSSGQNCRDSGQSIIVKAIMDNNIVKGADGGYYYLNGSGQVTPYSKIPETDNNYQIYNLLLQDPQVVKVVTADSSNGLYYVLKTTGDVYGVSITKPDRNLPAQVSGTTIVYSKSKFGANIEDFHYAGNSSATYVKTTNSMFRMKASNYKECSKYADIQCEYVMQESEEYYKYKDRMVAYNGSTLITDYGLTFTAAK